MGGMKQKVKSPLYNGQEASLFGSSNPSRTFVATAGSDLGNGVEHGGGRQLGVIFVIGHSTHIYTLCSHGKPEYS